MSSRRKPARSRSPEDIKTFAKGIGTAEQIADADPYLKVAVYGANNSGKTTFGATAPKALILDINEKGTRSIVGGKGFRVRVIEDWRMLAAAYWFLKAGNHPFESVVLDTVTAMQAMSLDLVMSEAEERDPTRPTRMPDKRAYGRAGKLTSGLCLHFRNLPMHVVFLGQERIIRNEDDGDIEEVTMELPKGVRGELLDSVGITGYLRPRRKGGKWTYPMLVGNHKTYRTKDKTGILGTSVSEPTMPKLIEAWKEYRHG